MREENAKKVIKKYEKDFPMEGFENFKRRVKEAPDSCFNQVFFAPIKNKVLGIFLSIFLGMFGVDRFYAQSPKFGYIKLGATVVTLIVLIFNTILALVLGVLIALCCIADIFMVYREVKICNYDIVNERLHNAIAKMIAENA